VLQRGLQQLLATPEADSIRAVELVKQHPGKMWVVDGKVMRPLLEQAHLDVAWHAGQYQALPEIYVQNSALEIAWTRVVSQTGTREGRVVAPFFTKDHEGFNVDDEEDWARARALVDSGDATLPGVERPSPSRPYPAAQ
jgi:CMP-N,N'-diacetyllegionaminic acid synthase